MQMQMQMQQQQQHEVYQDEYGNEIMMDPMQGGPPLMEQSDVTNALVSYFDIFRHHRLIAPPIFLFSHAVTLMAVLSFQLATDPCQSVRLQQRH